MSARVPPYPAARWAVRLREQGMSAQDIADQASHVRDPGPPRAPNPGTATTARDSARTSADTILGIPLPARRARARPAGAR
ncbi:hypothetical protein [Streptomyces sp. NPDC101165]|uniref:hypothetical protein n=1 Tax=Streptomyces sp. NPDC101165 TaxID=3366119 RepID=UPI003809C588